MSVKSQVPFVDLGPIHRSIAAELEESILQVARDGDFVLGNEVERFESAFADYIGVAHCVGIASGTSALTIGLLAAGFEAGAEVIVPAHGFFASPASVIHAGLVPVFCDVDPTTGLLDVEHAESLVGPRTAALMPVHLYGQMCALKPVVEVAERHGLLVIEDAAQAHGARSESGRAGAIGDIAAFSFYPSKNLGAFGDGGALCTNDQVVADQARALRNLGQRAKGEHTTLGFNERLDTLQAAVLRVKLPYLDGWNASRVEAASLYEELLPRDVARLPLDRDGSCVYHLYPVRLEDRDRVREHMAKAGVGTGIHYSPASNRHAPIADRSRGGETPVSDEWAAQVITLPIFAGISSEQIEQVCGAIAESL